MNPSTTSSVASLGNIGRWAVAPLQYIEVLHLYRWYTHTHTQLFHTQLCHTTFTQPVSHHLLSFLPFPSHFHICLVIMGRSWHVGLSGPFIFLFMSQDDLCPEQVKHTLFEPQWPGKAPCDASKSPAPCNAPDPLCDRVKQTTDAIYGAPRSQPRDSKSNQTAEICWECRPLIDVAEPDNCIKEISYSYWMQVNTTQVILRRCCASNLMQELRKKF